MTIVSAPAVADAPLLTLITCHRLDDTSRGTPWRRVVVAERVE